MSSVRAMKLLGALAVAFYAIHGVDLVLHHAPWDLLWSCHIACLLVGFGCLAASRETIAIGVTWLAVGVSFWILDLSTGGTLSVTSLFTHVGGPVVGVVALRRLGWPKGTWWRAVLALFVLMAVTRLATPRAANVNIAFSVWPGWQRYFPDYPAYFALLMITSAVTFFAVERVAAVLGLALPRGTCATSFSTR